MTGEDLDHAERRSEPVPGAEAPEYDPFSRGRFPVGVRTIQALDGARNRLFPCEIWYPAAAPHAGQDLAPATQDCFADPPRGKPRTQTAVRDAAAQAGTWPLILFSHSSGGRRRQSTFLCTHLSSHGYLVAALDHSEVVAPELARKEGETAAQKAARTEAWIANRLPDVQFLLDHLLDGKAWNSEAKVDSGRTGIVGHSFGGWTALAAPAEDGRIRTVVALAPGGNSKPKPGILPVKLTFAWGRDVPTLYLAAENDVSTPLAGIYELFDRTPASKLMIILRRADHLHFMDDVEQLHEAVRAMPFPGELAWMPKEMRPISELCSGEQAHLFVRGLTVCHLDAVLRHQEGAQRILADGIEAELGRRGIDAIVHRISHVTAKPSTKFPFQAS
jgi:predicted dienelactone hydrolase